MYVAYYFIYAGKLNNGHWNECIECVVGDKEKSYLTIEALKSEVNEVIITTLENSKETKGIPVLVELQIKTVEGECISHETFEVFYDSNGKLNTPSCYMIGYSVSYKKDQEEVTKVFVTCSDSPVVNSENDISFKDVSTRCFEIWFKSLDIREAEVTMTITENGEYVDSDETLCVVLDNGKVEYSCI